jgi:hypothetical protein
MGGMNETAPEAGTARTTLWIIVSDKDGSVYRGPRESRSEILAELNDYLDNPENSGDANEDLVAIRVPAAVALEAVENGEIDVEATAVRQAIRHGERR